MAVIKCKMCGGNMELSPDKTFGTCEYCGSTMTLPKVEDDQRAAAFNRGNHFRRIGEFDKALAVYERIVQENEADAEAHWCCVLCRFGIEYVEDPLTYEWIPTCHRASFDSVLEDVDYLAAVEHSDGITRRQYQKDAAKIAEVQKGILATSQNEKPFDVFICYKETDGSGERTRDSILAQEIYYQLTEQGRRVFFARLTLEDKIGTQYEPYIFAALNSAKVMVVVGTSAANLNAVWVKNEWSRFLALMKKDRSKLLLPCYRDMDPYDLPEQLSVLQSYDMGKIGFMQDLTRGISKVLDANKKSEPVQTTVQSQGTNAPAGNAAALLERTFMFLEDGDWQSADEYCERVLDADPKNAQAYLGKLMASLRVKKQDNLADCAEPFDDKANYSKVLRFADPKLCAEMEGYNVHIRERNEQTRLEGLYEKAVELRTQAKSEEEYKDAAEAFAETPGYRDADLQKQDCYKLAEEARKDAIYTAAERKSKASQIDALEEAVELFRSVSGWKDADDQAYACQKKIQEIKIKQEEDRLEKARQAEIARKKARDRAKKLKKLASIVAVVAVACIAAALLVTKVIIPNGEYNDVVALMEAGRYEEAISAFKAMDGYKDSAQKIVECETAILDGKYTAAVNLMDAGQYEKAISEFEALNGYKDSAQKITTILDGKYEDAVALMNAGNINDAYSVFTELGYYKDAADKAGDIRLTKTKEQLKNVEVGSYIEFGVYEQDNNRSNGKEDVEWLVLEVKNGKALVVSKYALDCKPYNTTNIDVTWETCTLRKWLNDSFINTAFSNVEKAIIPVVTVSADRTPECSTNPGSDTQDQVFLLSIIEASRYFSSNNARQCNSTEYAVANGTKENDSGLCLWWLRSPGCIQNEAARVVAFGNISVGTGGSVDNDNIAVRPALWIDLSAG